jgi:hypothetical protein
MVRAQEESSPLGDLLARWVQELNLSKQDIPFNRVWGQDLPPDKLWKICRDSPLAGERGIWGDIKLSWDFSRAHFLPLNALLAGEPRDRYLEASADFIHQWMQCAWKPQNHNWTCAMEVSMRAVNWICANEVWRGELRKRIGEATWDNWIWNHGVAIWRQLEAYIVCSNHYLSNLMVLIFFGTVFAASNTGR